PVLDLLVAAVDAAAARFDGDIDRALALLARPIPGLVPGPAPAAVTRFHWHLLLLAGRAGDAAALMADRDPVRGIDGAQELHGVARSPDGAPSRPWGVGGPTTASLPLSGGARFERAALTAVLAASAGEVDMVHAALAELSISPFAGGNGPDGAVVAVARACGAVVEHDDRRAEAEIAAFLACGPRDRVTDTFLRRTPAVLYASSPDLRRDWDAADLGPSQARALAAARLLVDARAGRRAG